MSRKPTPQDMKRAFRTIRSYLCDGLPLQEAVDTLATPIEQEYDTGENADTNDNFECQLAGLWKSFNEIVEQIPHDHPAHAKMAELFVAIRTRPTTPRPAAYGGDIWLDVPHWEPTLFDPWCSPVMNTIGLTMRPVDIAHDVLGQVGGKETLRECYQNQNAFLARLAPMEGALDVDKYALSAIRWALEDDLNAEGYWLNMPGATMWFIYAGEYIYNSKHHDIEPWTRTVGMQAPKQWWPEDKPNGFSRERWAVWKQGLSELVDVEEIDGSTRDLMRQAIDAMEAVESSAKDKEQ